MKKGALNIRLDEDSKNKLSSIAEEEKRDISNLARFLIVSFCEIHPAAQHAVIEILKKGNNPRYAREVCRLILIENADVDESPKYDVLLFKKFIEFLKNEGG